MAKEGKDLPITSMDMTRFNISLEQGVEMVMWAIENALGGEIFVSKIPSYKIDVLARAIAPNAKLIETGIRPGEKLHEEMITSSDSYNTIEFDKYYAILSSDADKDKYLKHYKAKLIEPGFQYNSGTNTEWETEESLRELIKKYVDKDFEPIQ
jgi:FlaA1/EpsC-like NDP-sugar epimerase